MIKKEKPEDVRQRDEDNQSEPDPDATAELLDALERERDELAAELADLTEKYQRSLAEQQNVRRRSLLNEEEARRQGTRSVVESVIPVMDHFDLALAQPPDAVSAEQVIDGVRVIRDELLRVLSRLGVEPIAPDANDEFEPGRHEAVMQAEAEGVEPGRVASMLQAGFMLEDRVVRPAKVSVAPGTSQPDETTTDQP